MNSTTLCGFNMSSADLTRVVPSLAMLCFNPNVRSLTVIGKSIKSYEEILLERIGQYAGSGSYIEMTDSDGSKFRWVFVDGKPLKIKPTLVWPELVAEMRGDIYNG